MTSGAVLLVLCAGTAGGRAAAPRRPASRSTNCVGDVADVQAARDAG
jgi:hypothetical protein